MHFPRVFWKKSLSLIIALSLVTAQIPALAFGASFLAPPGGVSRAVFSKHEHTEAGDLSSIVDDGILVVALGGNAFKGETGDQQMASLRVMLEPVAALIRAGQKIVITHGNGLQIGRLLEKLERSVAHGAIRQPMYELIAQTQREIGQMIQEALVSLGVKRGIKNMLTRVQISEKDPALQRFTKPVGPFMTLQEKREREKWGWVIEERINPDDPERSFRRVVPSPIPIDIGETDQIMKALHLGEVPIACGGGGIPVVKDRRTGVLRGFDGVIDKDRATVLMASKIDARRVIILTGTPQVYRRFNTIHQEPIDTLTVDEARIILDGLEEGSMKPKVEAAIDFIVQGGRTVIITDGGHLLEALRGKAGTLITAQGGPSRRASRAAAVLSVLFLVCVTVAQEGLDDILERDAYKVYTMDSDSRALVDGFIYVLSTTWSVVKLTVIGIGLIFLYRKGVSRFVFFLYSRSSHRLQRLQMDKAKRIPVDAGLSDIDVRDPAESFRRRHAEIVRRRDDPAAGDRRTSGADRQWDLMPETRNLSILAEILDGSLRYSGWLLFYIIPNVFPSRWSSRRDLEYIVNHMIDSASVNAMAQHDYTGWRRRLRRLKRFGHLRNPARTKAKRLYYALKDLGGKRKPQQGRTMKLRRRLIPFRTATSM